MIKKTFNRLGLLSVFMCVLTACNKQNDATTTEAAASTPATTAHSGLPVYRVATLAAFPPFVQRDGRGNPIGFDIDLLNEIGKEEGFQLQYKMQLWQGILEELNSNQHDIVAAGVVVTPERQKLYDFSDNYMDTKWALVLKDKTAEGKPPFKSFNEAVRASKVFTTEYGAAGQATLEKIVSDNQTTMINSETPYLEIANVLNGKADAAYDNARVLEFYVFTRSQDPTTKMYTLIDPNSPVNQFSFAVKKGRNDDLLNKINSGLKKLKDNGKYQQIREKWFGKSN